MLIMKFHSFVQNWSQNLKFSKKAEIRQYGYIVICDYGFDVYFFKMPAIQFCGQIWPQNLVAFTMALWLACDT